MKTKEDKKAKEVKEVKKTEAQLKTEQGICQHATFNDDGTAKPAVHAAHIPERLKEKLKTDKGEV